MQQLSFVYVPTEIHVVITRSDRNNFITKHSLLHRKYDFRGNNKDNRVVTY